MRIKLLFCAFFFVLHFAVGKVSAEPLLALSVSSNSIFSDNLIQFDSRSPSIINSVLPIAGLLNNDVLIGIDFYPTKKVLYGLGADRTLSTGRLYTVSPKSGNVFLVGASTFALDGGFFGFDVNPMTGEIRVLSDLGQNILLNSDTGEVVALETAPSYALGDRNEGFNPAGIVGASYSNNIVSTNSTTLYNIDYLTDSLSIQSLTTGILNTVGQTGIVTANGFIGFDISGFTGKAYASMTDSIDGLTRLYDIDLQTGMANAIGLIGNGQNVIDGLATTVFVISEPTSLTLVIWEMFVLIFIGFCWRRPLLAEPDAPVLSLVPSGTPAPPA